MALILFTDNDLNRALKYLGYAAAFTSEDYVQQQMAAVETQRPTIVPLIQGDLDLLDQLDALLTTEQGSTNAALIKADVLEWQPGAKTAGIEARMNAIVARLGNMLGLNSQSGRGWQSNALARG